MPIPRGTKAGTILPTYLCPICDTRKPADEYDPNLLGIKCNECRALPIISNKRIKHIFEDDIEKKHCCKCKEYKPIEKYNPCKNSWDKLRPECKDCLHLKRVNNKSNMTEYNKKYWEKTKVEQSAKHKTWVKNNKEHVDKYNKIYRSVNGKEIDKKTWQKRKDNPKYREYHKTYRRGYEKNKRATDPHYKIKTNFMRRIRELVNGEDKAGRSIELLGCTIDDFKQYLEDRFDEKMNWDNYALKGWHIDHIVPCAYFDLTNPVHQFRCFHYTNMQPMWGSENISKSDDLTEEAKQLILILEYLFPDEPEYDSDEEEDYEEFRQLEYLNLEKDETYEDLELAAPSEQVTYKYKIPILISVRS